VKSKALWPIKATITALSPELHYASLRTINKTLSISNSDDMGDLLSPQLESVGNLELISLPVLTTLTCLTLEGWPERSAGPGGWSARGVCSGEGKISENCESKWAHASCDATVLIDKDTAGYALIRQELGRVGVTVCGRLPVSVQRLVVWTR
jgi:hypothetical protein